MQFQRYAPDIRKSKYEYKIKLSTVPNHECCGDWSFNINSNYTVSDIALGANGKVYFATGLDSTEKAWLGMIRYPDSIGEAAQVKPQVYPLKYHYDESTFYIYSLVRFPKTTHPGFVRFHYKNTCQGMHLKNISDSIFTTFVWYFGDGDSLATTSTASFEHTFKKTGPLLLKLKGTTSYGYSAWYSDSIFVSAIVETSPQLDDSVSCQFAKITLNNKICYQASTIKGSIAKWDFGDGSIDTSINPSHIYKQPGMYLIRLKINNGLDSFSVELGTIKILPATPSILKVIDTAGCSPFTVTIYDLSKKGMLRLITSGNGKSSIDSVAQFTYKDTGTYWIKLTRTNPQGCSNADSQRIIVYAGNSKTELEYVSIENTHTAYLQWKPLAGQHYKIKRENAETHNIRFFNSYPNFFRDTTIEAQKYNYEYSIICIDSCQQESEPSNIAKTILLKAENEDNIEAQLHWTNYQDWKFGVEKYEVLRRSKTGSYTSINSISGGINFYQDGEYLTNESKDREGMCYQIRAYENRGNLSQSLSNEVCLPYQLKVWIPNAFSPNGDTFNDYFNPISVGTTSISIQIWNRWGEKVYEGINPKKGCDGRYKDKKAPDGVYIYRISAINNTGEIKYYSGTLVLMR